MSNENITIHRASTRGIFKVDWLNSHRTFSFGNYHNPERMNFGALRVINDDVIKGGNGFDLHPHKNIEIISIPLEGDLAHEDSMGNITVIRQGDIQLMSAGTGLTHSEDNKNEDQEVKFLQIWVRPNVRDTEPKYDQASLDINSYINNFEQIVSPNKEDKGVCIQQQAWFHIGKFDKDFETNYRLKLKGNGVYAFVIEGAFQINNQNLDTRDGMGISNIESLQIQSKSENARLLLMEVPMI